MATDGAAPPDLDATVLPPAGSRQLPGAALAQIQARYVVAQAHPRVWAQVRYELLHECQNLRFAEEAIWELEIGRTAQRGFTIRFAEAAARAMRNLHVEVRRCHEDAAERVMAVSVTDLESNYGQSREVGVEKYVLRKRPPRGEPPVVHQRNHFGEPLYRHPASEQDLLAKESSAVSKVRRNLILSFLPAMIREDCKVELARTLKAGGNKVAGHIPAAVLGAFADLGVAPAALEDYLGHGIIASSASELAALRSLAVALQEQELTWQQALEARRAQRAALPSPQSPAPAAEKDLPSNPNRSRPESDPSPSADPSTGPASPPGRDASTPQSSVRPTENGATTSSEPGPTSKDKQPAVSRSQMLTQRLRRGTQATSRH